MLPGRTGVWPACMNGIRLPCSFVLTIGDLLVIGKRVVLVVSSRRRQTCTTSMHYPILKLQRCCYFKVKSRNKDVGSVCCPDLQAL